MTSNFRIAVICNNKMAFPSLQYIMKEGMLCAIATSNKDSEIASLFKEKAREYTVPYYSLTHKDYKEQLVQLLTITKPDIVFVMTFPWLIPSEIFSIPRRGFLNFHYGLLPEMRGADPIFESIRQCKKTAGATIHIMDHAFDTGPVLLREEIPLSPEHTYGMLCSQMAWLGEKMCKQLIHLIKEDKEFTPVIQQEDKAIYWPRISRTELMIRWKEMDSITIKALVKAGNPITKGIIANINNWNIGVIEVAEMNLDGDTSAIAPGTIIALDNQNGLLVYCKDGKALKFEVIYIEEGVLPGYKLAQFGITTGMVFN
jgi:methionyl-tRNA formyltransferase